MTKKPIKPLSTLEATVRRIEQFLKAHPDMTEASFGLRAVQDTGLVNRLRAGRDITTRKLDMLLDFIANYKEIPAKASTNIKAK